MSMTTKCTAEDMEAVIHSRVHQLSLRKGLPNRMVTEIQRFLKAHAKGMFLWVSLILQQLKRRDQPLTNDALDAKLATLPRSLRNVHCCTGAADRNKSQRRLDYITMGGICKETAKIPELLFAICTELCIPEWHDFTGDVEALFGGLDVIDKEGTVEVVHHTLREFVLADFGCATYPRNLPGLVLDESKANSLLAEACLDIILSLMKDGYQCRGTDVVLPEGNIQFRKYSFHALGTTS